jgi:hypothetical protein
MDPRMQSKVAKHPLFLATRKTDSTGELQPAMKWRQFKRRARVEKREMNNPGRCLHCEGKMIAARPGADAFMTPSPSKAPLVFRSDKTVSSWIFVPDRGFIQ